MTLIRLLDAEWSCLAAVVFLELRIIRIRFRPVVRSINRPTISTVLLRTIVHVSEHYSDSVLRFRLRGSEKAPVFSGSVWTLDF